MAAPLESPRANEVKAPRANEVKQAKQCFPMMMSVFSSEVRLGESSHLELNLQAGS